MDGKPFEEMYKEVLREIKETIIEPWDHAFIVYEKDDVVIQFLGSLKNHKTVIFPKVPTAENMAEIALQILKEKFVEKFANKIKPIKVRLYETPNNWAEAF